MNRRLALKVFIIDKEISGLVIIKNKSLVPWQALGFIFNNHHSIGLYLLQNLPIHLLNALKSIRSYLLQKKFHFTWYYAVA